MLQCTTMSRSLYSFSETLTRMLAFLHPEDREVDDVKGERREETVINVALIL